MQFYSTQTLTRPTVQQDAVVHGFLLTPRKHCWENTYILQQEVLQTLDSQPSESGQISWPLHIPMGDHTGRTYLALQTCQDRCRGTRSATVLLCLSFSFGTRQWWKERHYGQRCSLPDWNTVFPHEKVGWVGKDMERVHPPVLFPHHMPH